MKNKSAFDSESESGTDLEDGVYSDDDQNVNKNSKDTNQIEKAGLS